MVTNTLNTTNNCYIWFKAYNCKLNITRVLNANKSLEIKNDYTQDIVPLITGIVSPLYLIKKTEKSADNSKCLVNIYPYLLKSKEEYGNTEEIFLMDKESQKFIFNENINYIKFL